MRNQVKEELLQVGNDMNLACGKAQTWEMCWAREVEKPSSHGVLV